ncbi:MAG TPA: N-acetylmuramoyl-L-alanine amidase, partial [Bryobacteraceae bacterium]|nr:N-acetylmuramoyl-L-alanine amidase [Bryobacteraceae bacterium]
MFRRLHMAALIGILPAIAAPNSGLITVTAVRSWSHTDSTRVIVETSGPFEYKSDSAHNPERLYIDVLKSQPWIDRKRYATHLVNDALVKRVRVAETLPGITRIVFDLTSPAELKISRLEAPDRLVIELRPRGTPAAISRPAEVSAPAITVTKMFTAPPRPPRRSIYVPPAPQLQAVNFEFPLALILPGTRALASVPAPRQNHPVSTQVLPALKAAPETSMPLASENASRSLTRALGLKVNRIVIDAGHGGHDDGTIGPHGVLEKDVVLDVALRLSKLVQERMGAEVVLTRSDDTFIPLHERTQIANDHKADLFLSIHANSSPSPEVSGTESFFLNFTSSPGAIDVAARENAGADKSVGELKDLIQSITLNDKITESQTFAQTVQTSLSSQAAKTNPNAHNRGVKRAPFVVLIGASMPSILAEIGFLSNERDERNLGKAEYRQKVAEALYKGLAGYSQSLSHFESPRQMAATASSATGV